jgi:light-regulated signal transduction histidine kinase (bacteriophytochrome)
LPSSTICFDDPIELATVLLLGLQARSREMGGTGLGLSMVRYIIEGHGRQLWVKSNQPIGSRFIIRLPIASLPATHQTNLFDQMRESNP